MKRKQFRKMLAGLLIVPTFSLLTAVSGIAATYVNVNKEDINLRSGPDVKYKVLYSLPKGYPLKVVSKDGQWLKVSDFENDQGWIYSSLVSENEYCIVKVREGNVRSSPKVRSDNKIGTVEREVILKKVKKQGDWILIEHPRLRGWVHRKLVWP